MGIQTTKVRLLAAAVCLLPWCVASLCPPGLQYWSNDSESCVNCSRCDPSARQVVMRPCQAHADTVCGPISELDIDWSWLRREHHLGDKKHHKHNNKHHNNLDDAETHQGRGKHHKHEPPKIIDEGGLDFNKKPSKKHHLAPESFLSEDFLPLGDHKRTHRLPPPPPLKSTNDLEKEWNEWLIQSRNRLQHRKDDLLKNLHRENPYSENHHTNHKLNHPSINSFDDSDGEIFHQNAHHKDHLQKKHFSPLDLEIFDRLLNHEHQKHEERLTLSRLLNPENKHTDLLDIMKSEDKKADKFRERSGGNDLTYPMDSFDFRSVVPTHRLFLGEPSTVSEIMDQDLSDESEDDEDESLKDQWQSGVIAVPFTSAETFVWDWQAVALTSAIAACLLFFTVVAIYSVLHARQWRRLKTNFDSDVEELSVKVGLMQSHSGGVVGASAADAANTNHYLEKLLENKKKNSNIYTQKRPSS